MNHVHLSGFYYEPRVKNCDKCYDRRVQDITSAYKNDPDTVFSDQKDSMGHNISPEI